MRAILLSNGSAIYFDADQTPDVDLTAMGWYGLSAFMKKYPQGIVSFAYGTPTEIKELPIPIEHVPMLIEKICPPGAESGCPHEHTVLSLKGYVDSLRDEHLPALALQKASAKDIHTVDALSGAIDIATNICNDLLGILSENVTLSGVV